MFKMLNLVFFLKLNFSTFHLKHYIVYFVPNEIKDYLTVFYLKCLLFKIWLLLQNTTIFFFIMYA